MGFTIEDLRREPAGAMYVSPARICVTADGELCEETDPRAVRLLVAKGCEIPAAEAAQYGLIAGVGTPAPEEPEEAPPSVDTDAQPPVDETPPPPPPRRGRGA